MAKALNPEFSTGISNRLFISDSGSFISEFDDLFLQREVERLSGHEGFVGRNLRRGMRNFVLLKSKILHLHDVMLGANGLLDRLQRALLVNPQGRERIR